MDDKYDDVHRSRRQGQECSSNVGHQHGHRDGCYLGGEAHKLPRQSDDIALLSLLQGRLGQYSHHRLVLDVDLRVDEDVDEHFGDDEEKAANADEILHRESDHLIFKRGVEEVVVALTITKVQCCALP